MHTAIRDALAGRSLTMNEASEVMGVVLDGGASPAQLGAWLSALAKKGETSAEVLGCARAMRERMLPVEVQGHIIDVVGTGGDGRGTFNASTAAALIASSVGATVAKSGNRAASGVCGSADLLEAVGVEIELSPQAAQQWLSEVGFAFLFSQRYHPALRALASIRQELGFRTIFNLLGPLGNPARPSGQVVGVARPHLAPLIAEVLAELGVGRALVVHSLDGLDEFSLGAPTEVHDLQAGQIRRYLFEPEHAGLERVSTEAQAGGTPAQNARMLNMLVQGEPGPIRDFCVLNAAAALVVAGLAGDLAEGVDVAAQALTRGDVAAKLAAVISRSQQQAAS